MLNFQFRLCLWAVLLVAIVLISLWLTVILVDFLNVGQVQVEILDRRYSGLPLVWYWFFREGQLVENLQWLLLGLSTLLIIIVWFELRRQTGKRIQAVLVILFFGLALMLVEDSLNFRHAMSGVVFVPLLQDSTDLSVGEIRMLWEASFYLMLASLMAIPIYLLWKDRLLSPSTFRWLIPAYGVYGLVAFGSALRRIGNWQERFGEYVIYRFSLLELPAWQQSFDLITHRPTWMPPSSYKLGYLLTDHLFEESVELIAAILLLVALTKLANDLIDHYGVSPTRSESP